MKKQNMTPQDKLTDKAFSRSMLISVIGILVCIACLCSATWAWFNAGVSSNSNKIEAGNFDLLVTVEGSDGEPLTVTKGADGIMTCTFVGVGTYTVTMTMTEDTTVTKGFCVMTVNGKDERRTASINIDGTDPFVFTLKVEEPDMSVAFEPAWGMPAHADVENCGELTIGTAATPSDE